MQTIPDLIFRNVAALRLKRNVHSIHSGWKFIFRKGPLHHRDIDRNRFLNFIGRWFVRTDNFRRCRMQSKIDVFKILRINTISRKTEQRLFSVAYRMNFCESPLWTRRNSLHLFFHLNSTAMTSVVFTCSVTTCVLWDWYRRTYLRITTFQPEEQLRLFRNLCRRIRPFLSVSKGNIKTAGLPGK